MFKRNPEEVITWALIAVLTVFCAAVLFVTIRRMLP